MRAPMRSPASRLAWLDALRGLAVLFVLYQHLGDALLVEARHYTDPWFPSGRVGVYLFFMVSGYIVPAALERHGSLRTFWISRAFRLFPLYLVVLGATLLLHAAGPMPLAAGADRGDALFAQLSMLPTLVHEPMILQVTWTLAFEMVFYLLVTALYTLRLHRSSATVAIAFAVGALALTPLPITMLAQDPSGPRTVAVVSSIVIGVGIAAAVSRSRTLAVAGGGLVAAAVLTLLIVDQEQPHRWDGLVIPAVMFTGTAIYRAQHRQIPWWRAGLAAVVVGAAEVWTQHGMDAPGLFGILRQGSGTVVLVGGLFAFGMWRGARWRLAKPLAVLGAVSYSVYLVHDLVVLSLGPEFAAVRAFGDPVADAVVAFDVAVVVVGVAVLTYRYVERPGQALGSRINRALDARAAARRAAGSGVVPVAGPVVVEPAVRFVQDGRGAGS